MATKWQKEKESERERERRRKQINHKTYSSKQLSKAEFLFWLAHISHKLFCLELECLWIQFIIWFPWQGTQPKKSNSEMQLFCFVKQINGRLIGCSVFQSVFFVCLSIKIPIICCMHRKQPACLRENRLEFYLNRSTEFQRQCIITTDIYLDVHVLCTFNVCTHIDEFCSIQYLRLIAIIYHS